MDYNDVKNDHKQQQTKYWSKFRDLLMELRSSEPGGANVAIDELVQSLEVGRQSIYNFIGEKHGKPLSDKQGNPLWKEGIQVSREKLLNLWAYISDPAPKRKLTEQQREVRRKLREEGPDRFLESLGFQTDKDELDLTSIDLKNPIVRRVASRLSSDWIRDETLRTYIANDINDRVLDQGRQSEEFYKGTISDREKIEKWPSQQLHSNEEEATKQYKVAIKNLARAGKTSFVASELFELYQSILEHVIVSNIDDIRIDIIDCQFTTLSQELVDSDYNLELDKSTEYFIKTQIRKAEDEIINLLQQDNYSIAESNDQEDHYFAPVLEAKVRCNFYREPFSAEKMPTNETTLFRFSSTGTHITNMLYAMKKNLGYPLEVSGFFMRAVGDTAESLARVSVVLTKDDARGTAYQGWWVTSNTILGLSKSVVDAVMRWVDDSKNGIEHTEYFEVCRELSMQNKDFFDIRKLMYGDASEIEVQSRDDIAERISSTIRKIEEITNEESGSLINPNFRIFKIQFNNVKDMLKLIKMHLCLLTSNIETAKEYLEEAKNLDEKFNKEIPEYNKKEDSNIQYTRVLSLYASSCILLYGLITGDHKLITGKYWELDKYKIDNCLKRLGSYSKSIEATDFDTYLCASQYIATLGKLHFYGITDKDTNKEIRTQLEKGVSSFIRSAHYDSRIGLMRRSIFWLTYACRASCRLGNQSESTSLLKIIEHNMSRFGFSNKQAIYRDWTQANVYILKGEMALILDQKKNKESLEYFLQALITTIETGFVELLPDCLYNIYRVKERIRLEQTCIPDTFRFNKLSSVEDKGIGEIITSIGFWEEFEKIRKFIKGKEIHFEVENREIYKDAALNVWNKWATLGDRDSHVIADAIEFGNFLVHLNDK